MLVIFFWTDELEYVGQAFVNIVPIVDAGQMSVINKLAFGW